MKTLGIFRHLLRFLSRRRLERELQEELRLHVELQTEANRRTGMSPEEASREARRQFGWEETLKEECRDQWGWRWLEEFFADARFGLRSLLRSRAIFATAVFTLAVGIGGSVSIFSVVNVVMLRPLGFPDADRLVAIRVILEPSGHEMGLVNPRFFKEWQATSAFSGLALIGGQARTMSLIGRGGAVAVSSMQVSPNLFSVLGVIPAHGRPFSAAEDIPGRASVVIITDAFWRNHLSASPSAVGSTIVLNHEPYSIVGILPKTFYLPELSRFYTGGAPEVVTPDVFIPRTFFGRELQNENIYALFNYQLLGRLAPGIDTAAAAAQLEAIAARLKQTARASVRVKVAIVPLHDAIVASARLGLVILITAILAVLLIACLNLSLLALARAEQQGQAFAIRSMLGASRIQVMRLPFVESLVVSLIGGCLGLLLALWGQRALFNLAPNLPKSGSPSIDPTVVIFVVIAILGTAIVVATVPARHLTRLGIADALRASATRSSTSDSRARRLRDFIVAVEVGIAVVLVCAALMLGHSFLRLINVEPGFKASDVVWTEIAVAPSQYKSANDRNGYFRNLLNATETTPGVTSSAIGSLLPVQGESWVDIVFRPDDTRPMLERPHANVRFISGGYFNTLGIPLTDGRSFNDLDSKRQVVVLSETLANRLWPEGGEVVGRTITFRGGGENGYEVIGVVADVRVDLARAPVPTMYLPYWALSPSRMILVLKLQESIPAVVPLIRHAIRGIDQNIPVQAFRTMDDVLQSSTAGRRFYAGLVSMFALFALGLAGLGIYGVVSHSVVQRTRELGIRVALGAEPRALLRLVLWQGLRPVAYGLVFGVLGAILVGSMMRSLWFELAMYNPTVIAIVVPVISGVAFVACWIPARYATRIDPIVAIRCE